MTADFDTALHHLAQRVATPPPEADAAPSTKGRDGRGRFAPGNPGGPGNPFARRSAALREALCEAVTEENLKDLARVLLLHAQGGDVPAAKLLPRPFTPPGQGEGLRVGVPVVRSLVP
jgi:hypothetical protein